MLELLLWLALVVAMRRSIRARHKLAILCCTAVCYLLLADSLASLAVSKPHQLFDFFGYLFLGPLSAAERAASRLPLPAVALALPLTVRATRIALSTFASWKCLHESAPLNPLLPRAYALDAIAMAFAGAAVVDALEGVLLLWASLLAAEPF